MVVFTRRSHFLAVRILPVSFGSAPCGRTLDSWDLNNVTDAKYDELIDKILVQVESDFQSVVREGGNGDYDSSGAPGEFGIRVLNSRDALRGDYPVPSLTDPLTTHLFIGGTTQDSGITGILGIAQSLDIGNFDMNEYSILPIDFFLPAGDRFSDQQQLQCFGCDRSSDRHDRFPRGGSHFRASSPKR